MKKIKDDIAVMAKFFVFLPFIVFSMLKMAIKVRKDMSHPNPEMWE